MNIVDAWGAHRLANEVHITDSISKNEDSVSELIDQWNKLERGPKKGYLYLNLESREE